MFNTEQSCPGEGRCCDADVLSFSSMITRLADADLHCWHNTLTWELAGDDGDRVQINPNVAAKRTRIICFPVPRKKQRTTLQQERLLKEMLSDGAGSRGAQQLAGGIILAFQSWFLCFTRGFTGHAKPACLLSCTAKDAPGASIANLCLSGRRCTAGAFVVGSPQGSQPTVKGSGC